MWYILEVQGNPAGSTRLGSSTILAIGTTLQDAQNRAVQGYLDGAVGSEEELDIERDTVDFAHVVQYTRATGNEVIALQVQANGTVRPHNR